MNETDRHFDASAQLRPVLVRVKQACAGPSEVGNITGKKLSQAFRANLWKTWNLLRSQVSAANVADPMLILGNFLERRLQTLQVEDFGTEVALEKIAHLLTLVAHVVVHVAVRLNRI